MKKSPDSTDMSELGWRLQKQFYKVIFGSLCMESKSKSFTISNRALQEFMEQCSNGWKAHFMIDGNESTDLTVSITWEK
jgi:hypothetical protein